MKDIYHCPADLSQANGATRVRSYAMNCWMGSRDMQGFRSFVNNSDLERGPLDCPILSAHWPVGRGALPFDTFLPCTAVEATTARGQVAVACVFLAEPFVFLADLVR